MYWCSHSIHTRQIPVWELLSLLLFFMGFHQRSFLSYPYSLPSLHGLIDVHHFSLLKNFLKFQAYLLDRDGKNHDSLKLVNRNHISYSGHPSLIPGKDERTGRCCTVERSRPWKLSGFWSIHSNLISILGIQISTKSSSLSSFLFSFFLPILSLSLINEETTIRDFPSAHSISCMHFPVLFPCAPSP